MRSLVVALTLAFTLALSSGADAQSLAEMAKKEKERRAQVKTAPKVITNSDSAKYSAGAVTTESLPPGVKKPESAAVSAEPRAKQEKQADDEPTDLFGRPESFWRQTFADARKRVKDFEDEARSLQLKIADLQNQFYREDNGFKQQELQREIQKSFYEQDLNKENLAKAKAELQQLEVDARKSGALPGWIEARTP